MTESTTEKIHPLAHTHSGGQLDPGVTHIAPGDDDVLWSSDYIKPISPPRMDPATPTRMDPDGVWFPRSRVHFESTGRVEYIDSFIQRIEEISIPDDHRLARICCHQTTSLGTSRIASTGQIMLQVAHEPQTSCSTTLTVPFLTSRRGFRSSSFR